MMPEDLIDDLIGSFFALEWSTDFGRDNKTIKDYKEALILFIAVQSAEIDLLKAELSQRDADDADVQKDVGEGIAKYETDLATLRERNKKLELVLAASINWKLAYGKVVELDDSDPSVEAKADAIRSEARITLLKALAACEVCEAGDKKDEKILK